MKPPRLFFGKAWLPFVIAGLACFLLPAQTRAQFPVPPETEYQPAQDEFDALGKAVLDLLKTRAADGFAAKFSVKLADWQSVPATNASKDDAERVNLFAKGADYNLQRLKSDAQAVLARADSLHLDFSTGNLGYRVVMPEHVGVIYLGNPATTKLTLPYVEKLDIILFQGDASNQSTNNSLKLTVRGLEKFPAGWRINNGNNGIQWTGFPASLVDEKTRRELALSEKIAANQPVTSEDDPALSKLAESLIRFIRAGDTNVFKKDLLLTSDAIWAMFEKSGRKGPTRKDVDEEMAQQNQEQVAAAVKLLNLMHATGIDLKNADIQIKSAGVENCQSQDHSGSLDQLIGDHFTLSLAVKSGGKAKNGTPLAGDYILAAEEIMKLGGAWKVSQNLHWEKFPPGVVDSQTAANIEFENYVAQYNALPPGTPAPEIEFTTLVGEKKLKLSDLKGKVVVLDFWATWCGPCQEPMAELQKIRVAHPGWQDKVAIVPVSIDDSLAIVRKHINQRGWTNTFNVWAGEGGWRSAPAKTFRVTAVPTSYVIDPRGKILWSGHPEADTISSAIDRQLE
jgi:thiol-disulfide isomerase/thioredoxin